MITFEILLAVALLVICGFAPGFFFIRHFRWSPMEKLCGSLGASFALIYLVFTAVYDLSPNEVPSKYFALVSAVFLAMGFAARRDVVRLFGSLRVRRSVTGFFFLLGWTILILALIRNYSGADWYGDWLEHFQRALFYLQHFPKDTPLVTGYALPARPPAMNEIAAFFLAQTQDRFEIFQVVFAYLNLLMFLPCCLIMPVLVGRRRISIFPLVVLFALNPMVMQNVTYTWTKAFTAFYVILAIWFYLAGWRKQDRLRMIVAFVAISMGLLVHYSAAPYLLFLTLHYLLCVFWKRPGKFREIATIAMVCGLLLATWFGWSIAVYGAHATIASNSSVESSQRIAGSNLIKVAGNLYDSIVPVILRAPHVLDDFDHQGPVGVFRDDVFVFYQKSAVFGMGLVGGPLILWLLAGAFKRPLHSGGERKFWLAAIPFSVLVGIASVGERGPQGVAHLTLLSIVILGLSLLAGMFPLRRSLLVLVVAGCLVDFSLGILLQARIENLENTSQRTVFPGLGYNFGKQSIEIPTSNSLSDVAWANWFLKHKYALSVEKFDELSKLRPVDAAVGRRQMQASVDEDNLYWRGWYARNDGSIGFLGDHTAAESGWATTVLTSMLVIIALLMLGFLFR